MANVLLDLLRQLAIGAVADEARATPQGKSVQDEYVKPVVTSLLDAIVPPAAAADASAIPQQNRDISVRQGFDPIINEVPADRVLTQEEEQLITPRVRLPDGRVQMPTITMQEPTKPPMVDVTDEQQVQDTQDFVRSFGPKIAARAQKLMAETPEGADPKGAAALASIEALAANADKVMDNEPMDLGAPVVGPKDVALGMYPNGKPAESTGGFFDSAGKFFSDLFGDEERMTRLALAFNSMRYQPDQGLATVLGKRLETLGTTRKANATAQALRAKGTPAAIQAAQYIEQTGDAKGGLKMVMEADQYVTGSGKEISEKYGITGLIPNKPYRYNKVTKKVEGVGGGDTIFEATKPSKGYEFVRDESGKILYEQPIPKKITPERAGTKIQSAELVLDDMNRLTNLIEESPKLTTGFGTMLSSVPTTAARDAQALAGTIKANIGFDRLQRMREESPTGGALGQVAVQELQALQSTLGSLDLGQSTDQVLYNVNRLKKQYAKTMLALADSQPNFSEYFPEFDRAAYEKILSEKDGQQPAQKTQITPEQAAAELARRRGK